MPALALGDAVAHRRHAAGDLRGRADVARGLADQFRIALVRLMRRQHVVVGGDDARCSALHRRADRRLVRRVAGGEAVREIAAGQALAMRPVTARAIDFFEVCARVSRLRSTMRAVTSATYGSSSAMDDLLACSGAPVNLQRHAAHCAARALIGKLCRHRRGAGAHPAARGVSLAFDMQIRSRGCRARGRVSVTRGSPRTRRAHRQHELARAHIGRFAQDDRRRERTKRNGRPRPCRAPARRTADRAMRCARHSGQSAIRARRFRLRTAERNSRRPRHPAAGSCVLAARSSAALSAAPSVRRQG